MSLRVCLPSGVSSAARSIPASANAWSVGAKTVNGPGPDGFQVVLLGYP